MSASTTQDGHNDEIRVLIYYRSTLKKQNLSSRPSLSTRSTNAWTRVWLCCGTELHRPNNWSSFITSQHLGLPIHTIHDCSTTTTTTQQPFNRTTWVSWHQKGKPFWILLEQQMMGWQWHHMDHMQIICTSLQTDNHASNSPVPHHSVFIGWMPFLLPNQQCQITDC